MKDRRESGQSIVEFALVLPVLMLLMMGMLEFGLAFNHHLTLEYATREASRTGTTLSKGGSANCIGGVDAQGIDAQTIAAAERILKSPGSAVVLPNIVDIQIFKADSVGNQVGGLVNVWRYTPGAGPDIDLGAGIDKLDFSPVSTAWPVCSRSSGPNPDSMGVRIAYTYRFSTPLGSIMTMVGGTGLTQLAITDQTVMAINPDR